MEERRIVMSRKAHEREGRGEGPKESDQEKSLVGVAHTSLPYGEDRVSTKERKMKGKGWRAIVPRKVAPKKVQKGIRKWPQQIPQRSKAKLGQEAMRKTPRNPWDRRKEIIRPGSQVRWSKGQGDRGARPLRRLTRLYCEVASSSSGTSVFSPASIAACLAALVSQ
jgi:hypothetical protein